MAGPAPKTEKWTARENRYQPDDLHLIVSGTVEVDDADKAPVLKLASGDAPDRLALDLEIEPCGDPAIDTPVWKAASFNTVVQVDQYHGVDIRWDGEVIASTPVINDLEHSELLEKQSNVQNRVAGRRTGAAKSPVKKAVKRVVAAVEDLAQGAKKVVKKVLKKAAKKTAKKAPKKAAKAAAPTTAKKAAKSRGKAVKTARMPARKAAKKSARKMARKSAKKARRR